MGLIDTVLNFFKPKEQQFVSPLPDNWKPTPPQPYSPPANIPQAKPRTPTKPPGGGGGGGSYTGSLSENLQSPQESVGQLLMRSISDNMNRLNDAFKAKGAEFDRNNPFSFDDVLAEERTKVKQRLDPYYEQTLSDFLLGVTRKKERSLEDERKVLGELSEDTDQVVGEAKKNVDLALEKSAEGYADAGLYGSGQQLREEGRIKNAADETGPGAILRSAERKRADIQTGTKRTMEDLSLAETLKRRDIGREQEYQTQAQSLEEAKRRESQRLFERSQYTGNPPGTNPSQFEDYAFGLLG